MPTYRGVTGKIAYADSGASAPESYLAHMTTWNVEMSKEIDETPYFGGSATEEGFTEKTPGVKSWTASADGAVDFGDTSSQAELLAAYNNDTVLQFFFYLDATHGFTGEGYVESLSFSHAADGKAELSISVAGNKTPTMVGP